MHLFLQIYVHAFDPLCVLAALAAWRWGSRTEVQAACLLLIATIAQRLWESGNSRFLVGFDWRQAAIDWTLFIAFVATTARRPRWWMVGITAFQLFSALAHIAKLIDGASSQLAYGILVGSGGYPILILLSAGIVTQARQRARMQRSARSG